MQRRLPLVPDDSVKSCLKEKAGASLSLPSRNSWKTPRSASSPRYLYEIVGVLLISVTALWPKWKSAHWGLTSSARGMRASFRSAIIVPLYVWGWCHQMRLWCWSGSQVESTYQHHSDKLAPNYQTASIRWDESWWQVLSGNKLSTHLRSLGDATSEADRRIWGKNGVMSQRSGAIAAVTCRARLLIYTSLALGHTICLVPLLTVPCDRSCQRSALASQTSQKLLDDTRSKMWHVMLLQYIR